MTDNNLITISDAQIDEAQQYLNTIRDMVRFCVTQLRVCEVDLGQGTTDFFAEAAALVMQPLNLDWSISPEILDAKLCPSEKQAILALLQQRINQRTPLAYLLNLAYFCGKPFYVDERVIVPRSPIAELIQTAFSPYFMHPELNSLDDNPFNLPSNHAPYYPQRILDLCTGSGCIAICLASVFEDAYVDAIDISLDALSVASVNVSHHGADNVSLIESNLWDKIQPSQQYDLIVSNPPYVDAEDMAELPPEFLKEPELALASGQDGLDITLSILAHAANYLTEQGLLVVEVGNSEWALQQLFPEVAFHWLQLQHGHGVFALSKAELIRHQAKFSQAHAIRVRA